jgi:hypothetical protein
MTWTIQATGETVFTVYEDATATTSGATDITAYNNDRNSTDTTSLTLLQKDGDVSGGAGTQIFTQAVGIADTPTRIRGGADAREREIILKQNSTYRFLIESNSNSNIISVAFEWYEHTNKNDTN